MRLTPPQKHYNDIFDEALTRRLKTKKMVFLAVSIVIILSLLIIFWRFKHPVNQNVKLIFVAEDDLADTYRGQAVIIRDERIYQAPNSGIVNQFVPEGTRVAKNQLVAGVYSEDKAEMLAEYKRLDIELANRRYEIIHNGFNTVAEGIYKDYEQELKHSLQNVYSAKATSQLRDLANNEATIKGIFDRRNQSLRNFNYGNDAQLIDLQDQFEKISEKLQETGQQIEAMSPGVVMYTFDGLGKILSSEKLDQLTVEQVQDILRNPQSFQKIPEKTEKNAELFAMTEGAKQFFAAILPASAAKKINPEIPLQVVELSSGLKLDNCEIIRTEETPLGSLVIFRCDNYLERFINQRTVLLSVSANSKRGLRVPRSALMNYEANTQLADVYLVVDGYITKTPVNIEAINDQYALISSPEVAKAKVESGSMVVINPDVASDNTPLDSVNVPE